MQDFPLTVSHLRRRMTERHPGSEVATYTGEGIERASFGDVSLRVDRLARALGRLGVKQGDRVATFAWNNQRHFELYIAVPCVGAVLHTLNVRLFSEQLTYIVNHAQDGVIFVDDSLVPILERLVPTFEGVRHYVVMGEGESGSLPDALRYEELLEDAGEGAFRLSRARRAPSRCALLHERDDGQPQGRALLAPLDQLALHRRDDERRPLALQVRQGARRRAHVPRQRLGHPPRRGPLGHRSDHARPPSRRAFAREADRGRAPHDRGLRAHDLFRPASLRGGE